ncbi:glycoside hydrolase family 76 protein [Aaosphaeria arxii CBS 175.79]|uniref:mannan endo-1,6-alpha-mannosidase n=1 Tax=Aaosphaeria arxii CBS 175.79 TaxID=1450172 RepID=A0A6A5XCQ3_9PLEO|nr:glycoside hydrolase family 76 protein [Aaosphaeria arxii CBS 175.79]KAF2010587.1 glycoside hydrolase family 76 protein [Aaosphaeria arxii CBS 175.79]
MRHIRLVALSAAATLPTPKPIPILGDPSEIANVLLSKLPSQSQVLLPKPFWWWQSGTVVDSLLTLSHTTNTTTHNALITTTLLSQATGSNDFMTPDATGNDDQAWWSLAALSAAEYNLPSPSIPWNNLASNVFAAQKSRWDDTRCKGGIKWKIKPEDDGWHYKSTIANGLFFQLAARLGRYGNDGDALAWAEKSYDWTVSVGLISPEFDVFDGTDDAKGEGGCVDVNHDMWSYNVGVFLYGAAVMAEKTGEERWRKRARGFLDSAKRNFVKDGRLFEGKCDGDGSCDNDQVSFKAQLARWLGATAVILPELRGDVVEMLGQIAEGEMGESEAGKETNHELRNT